MVNENNDMSDKTKLAIITGNVQAMESLVQEINNCVSAARKGIEWNDPDKPEDIHRLYSALGGLSGIQEPINALKALVDASFCIYKS